MDIKSLPVIGQKIFAPLADMKEKIRRESNGIVNAAQNGGGVKLRLALGIKEIKPSVR